MVFFLSVDSCAAIAKARKGYVPVAKLDTAKDTLATAEERIVLLTKELEAAKASMISFEERAKAAVATAEEEERKASDSVILGLQDNLGMLENHVTDSCRKLLGEYLFLLPAFLVYYESPSR